MKTFPTSPKISPARVEFENLLEDIRPELHRYVARMVGSAIDGEDVVQETLLKANSALPSEIAGFNLRGWLFRIAHNKAIDFLRRKKLQTMEKLDEQLLAAEPELPLENRELAKIALAIFLKLAPRQRSCVILKDVLDYTLAEISEFLDATVPEIKAVLHRGRTRLRELAESAKMENKPVLSEEKRALLNRYVKLFNQRDFDGVRDLLADEVRLDLVGRLKQKGASEIRNNYFRNYDSKTDWRFAVGAVENNPAILVYNPQKDSDKPEYFILLEISDDKISNIRDYRYASYVIEEARISVE